MYKQNLRFLGMKNGFSPLPEEQWITHTFCGQDWLCMEMAITREVYFANKKSDG